MKIKAIILIIFNLTIEVSAQIDPNVSNCVKQFFDTLNYITKDIEGKKGITENFSSEEVFNLAKIYYMAIAQDPIGYKKNILSETDKFTKKIKENKYTNEPSPQLKKGAFLSLLTKTFGAEFTKIISIPYFLRVKILYIQQSTYLATNGDEYGQTNLLCKIEEVLKGNKIFKKDSIVTFYYLNRWGGLDCQTNFQKNKSYFFPVEVRYRDCNNCLIMALQMLPDNNCGTYPIENDTIYTPGNYFKIAESTSWNTFKDNFLQKYVLIMEGVKK